MTKDVHNKAMVKNEIKGLEINLAMMAANPKLTNAIANKGRYVFFKNTLAENVCIIRFNNII